MIFSERLSAEKLTFKKITIFFLIVGLGIFFIKVFHKRTDFPCFYLAGERFLHKENLYVIADEWPYKYPPSAAFFFLPLEFFSAENASVIFYFFSFLSMVLSYFLMIKILLEEKVHFSLTSIFITFLLLLKFHDYDFSNLQVNHFSLFFLICSYYLYEKDSSESKKWIAAGFFSMGSLFKIIPFFISCFYVLNKEFKQFFRICFSFILLMLIPAGWYGWANFNHLLHQYNDLMHAHHEFFSTNPLYQSLPAMIARFANFFELQNPIVLNSILGLFVFALAALVLIMMARSKEISRHKKILQWIEFSSCLIFYPLVNPVGWKHGYVFLMPAIFLAVHLILERSLYKRWSYRFLILFYLLVNVLLSQLFIGKSLSDYKDLLSSHVLSGITVLVVMFLLHKEIVYGMSEENQSASF